MWLEVKGQDIRRYSRDKKFILNTQFIVYLQGDETISNIMSNLYNVQIIKYIQIIYIVYTKYIYIWCLYNYDNILIYLFV